MPALEIETTSLAGVETPSSVENIEPAFDLSISDSDVAPLEGLESSADMSQFAIDPEMGNNALGVEGLISSEPIEHTPSSGEPGLGEPLLDEDPLAGLNILEDDRFFVHEPVAEDNSASAASEETTATAHAEDAAVDDQVPPIEDHFDLQLEHPELHPEPEPQAVREPEPEPEPPKPAPRPVAPPPPVSRAAPEPPPVRRAAPAPPQPVARRAPEPVIEQEPEEEVEQEEDVLEEEPAPKSSRPQLVPPLRMTRPKPKKPKTPEREEPPAAPAQKQPVNPFMRQRQKPKAPSPKAGQRVATPPQDIPRAATPKENTPQQPVDNFVDLADWLREERGPRSYRMVAEEDHNREEGEEADFTDMLEKFKAGVAANVDDEDFDSHYDLGVAYKEMGLIEEAIAEFQKALRGATQRIRAYEALGQCFIDRNDFDTAITVLGRALREPGMEDEDLIGVLYLLGFASEGSKKPRDAAAYYQRVFAIDIDFRDVSKRLKQMTKAASK